MQDSPSAHFDLAEAFLQHSNLRNQQANGSSAASFDGQSLGAGYSPGQSSFPPQGQSAGNHNNHSTSTSAAPSPAVSIGASALTPHSIFAEIFETSPLPSTSQHGLIGTDSPIVTDSEFPSADAAALRRGASSPGVHLSGLPGSSAGRTAQNSYAALASGSSYSAGASPQTYGTVNEHSQPSSLNASPSTFRSTPRKRPGSGARSSSSSTAHFTSRAGGSNAGAASGGGGSGTESPRLTSSSQESLRQLLLERESKQKAQQILQTAWLKQQMEKMQVASPANALGGNASSNNNNNSGMNNFSLDGLTNVGPPSVGQSPAASSPQPLHNRSSSVGRNMQQENLGKSQQEAYNLLIQQILGAQRQQQQQQPQQQQQQHAGNQSIPGFRRGSS